MSLERVAVDSVGLCMPCLEREEVSVWVQLQIGPDDMIFHFGGEQP